MSAATVHYLPSAGLGVEDDQAADVAALVEEVGRLAVLVDEARRERDEARRMALDASGAASLASAARLDYWADGYRAGFKSGHEVGYGQAAQDWKITARNTGTYDVGRHGLSWAELDARRYPSPGPGIPAGRVGWLADNLGGLWRSWAGYCAEGGQ